MENDIFGSVMYDGKMINLDKESIENLESKMITVFKQ